MVDLLKTDEFDKWMLGLRDRQAKARIAVRLDRMAGGNFGDAKSVGKGLMELRITHGPGYRTYYVWSGVVCVILLCGGDKGSQARDIVRAQELKKELGL